MPVLSYGMEALSLNKSQRQSIDHPWNKSFVEISSTFDNRIVRECQYYGGFLPISLMIDIRRMSLINKLYLIDNSLLYFVGCMFSASDITEIAKHYNITADNFALEYRDLTCKSFQSNVMTNNYC